MGSFLGYLKSTLCCSCWQFLQLTNYETRHDHKTRAALLSNQCHTSGMGPTSAEWNATWSCQWASAQLVPASMIWLEYSADSSMGLQEGNESLPFCYFLAWAALLQQMSPQKKLGVVTASQFAWPISRNRQWAAFLVTQKTSGFFNLHVRSYSTMIFLCGDHRTWILQ